MSNLVLPFQGPPVDTNGAVFQITQNGPTGGSGGIAIYAESYGKDPRDGESGYAISGSTDSGVGLFGTSQTGTGVQGQSGDSGDAPNADLPAGVVGSSNANYGVYGSSANADGVKGACSSPLHAGVSGINTAPVGPNAPAAFGVWAWSNNTGVYGRGTPAAYFEGDVQVTGDLVLVNSPAHGDVAEDFDVEDDPSCQEPGTVLVIGACGKLRASTEAYDTRVAGVISGAGELRPAIVLQRVESGERRSPVALLGKTFCKVDATFGKVSAGDLLTTSPRPGHAMTVTDRVLAVGAILGKALSSLETGCGLIPILVSPR